MSLVRFRNWAFLEKSEYGILAQLVEHLTFNQVVRGSNPRCLMTEETLKSQEMDGFSRFLLLMDA